MGELEALVTDMDAEIRRVTKIRLAAGDELTLPLLQAFIWMNRLAKIAGLPAAGEAGAPGSVSTVNDAEILIAVQK